MSTPPVYLDHHATTPLDPRVRDALWPYFHDRFGNAGSISHRYGWDAAEAVTRARQQVAELLHTDPAGIVFTSGATEANNLALKGLLAPPAGRELVVSAGEHKAVLGPAQRLRRAGCRVTTVPLTSDGTVDLEQLDRAVTPETSLVSVLWASNEVGAVNPISEIAALCRARGVRLHTDAAQAAGKLPIDVAAAGLDLLSLSGHKLYAPQGVGVLYVRPGAPRLRLEPLFDGGGQEGRLRSGTLPVALIVGLGAACEIAGREMDAERRRLAELRQRLWDGLRTRLTGLRLNGPETGGLPGNLNVSFEGVDGEALMTSLTRIAVSSGSACTSADPEPSHVLRALGLDDRLARASLRFGLGRFTTAAEIDIAIAEVATHVLRLRGLTGRS